MTLAELLPPGDHATSFAARIPQITMNTTSPSQLVLSRAQDASLRAAAENAYPAECCGLLAGTGEASLTLTQVVNAANIATDPQRQFTIDPQVHFDLLRRLRGTGERVIGHYHSHPNGITGLSRQDVAMADDPNAVWVIIALDAAQHARTPLAFVCPAGQEPMRIEIVIRP